MRFVWIVAASMTQLLAVAPALALSPTNVLVLVNRANLESLAVANHYRLKRNIPDENFVYLDYHGDRVKIDSNTFQREIYQPALKAIQERQLGDRIVAWVTTPSFPIQVGTNSISGAIFFGGEQSALRASALGPAGFAETNPYFDQMIAANPPAAGTPPRYLHMMLDAGLETETIKLIDRSVAADGTRPNGTVFLLDGVGPRNVRKISIPAAMRMLETLGADVDHRPGGQLNRQKNVLGIFTGAVKFNLNNITFLPGALGDHLTSMGGALFGNHGQMICSEFLVAGCSATYGTVVEPYNYPQKFPSASLYVYYALGFSALESYWMSVLWPQQGLFLGDPLTCPFGEFPKVTIESPLPDQPISGPTSFAGPVESTEPGGGVGRIDVFMDDKRFASLGQNALPPGVTIELEIGKHRLHYITGPKESYASLVAGLTRELAKIPGLLLHPRGGNLLLLRPSDGQPPPVIQVRCASPALHLRVIRDTFSAGYPDKVEVSWALIGKAKRGDEVVVELQRDGGEPVAVRLPVTEEATSRQIASQIVRSAGPSMPEGFTLEEHPTADFNTAEIRLVAQSDALRSRPKIRLKLNKSAGSNLTATHDGQQFVMTDPTLSTYDIAWLQFGFGPKEIRLRSNADFSSLPNGRHVLRVVAFRGTSAQNSTMKTIPILLRNGTQRLTLAADRRQLSLSEGPARVVQAELTDFEAKRVDYLVNGQVATQSETPPFGAWIDPRQWGAGHHRLTARAYGEGEKVVWSENAVDLEITP